MAFKKRHDDVPVSVSVPETMIFLPMDAMLIEQVLINLMDNAVVHGGNVSQIKINAREEDGKAIVSVADNGRGIDAETLPHLFDGQSPALRQQIRRYHAQHGHRPERMQDHSCGSRGRYIRRKSPGGRRDVYLYFTVRRHKL